MQNVRFHFNSNSLVEKDPNLSQLLKDQLKETLLEARMMESVLTQIPEKDEEDDLSQRKGKSFLSLITGKQGNKTSKKEGTPIFKTK